MFKRDGALRTLGIFKAKRHIKYSRLVCGFQHQGSEGKSFLKGVFDVERATNLKVLQFVLDMRCMASLITHGSGALGEDTPRPFNAWALKLGCNQA